MNLFEYNGAKQVKPVKQACGHFSAESVAWKGKSICPKCATLVMGASAGTQTSNDTHNAAQGGKAATHGSAVETKGEATEGEKGEEQEAQSADGTGDAKAEGAGKGKGDASEVKGEGGNGDMSEYVRHDEMPAILTPIEKAAKALATEVKLIGTRMDNGQKEIELAKAAFDSHTVRIDGLQVAIEACKAQGVDEETIKKLVAKHSKLPPVIQITDVTGTTRKVEGTNHKQFAVLLQTCSARLPDGHRMNVWLKGPAGSGKTTAAANVAKALGLQFAFNGALDSEYKLKGFIDATGKVCSTPFRKVWEEGGVYLFDEVDASLPSAVLGFNAALANGSCDFPDANIVRHPDCVIIAAANTFGGGATADYVGRAKQDAAFLDRFVSIAWDIDETLETALTQYASWSSYVQKARRKVTERGLKGVIVSPRASLFGASMLRAGIDSNQVIAMVIRKGMTDDQWTALDLPAFIA